MVCSLPPLFCDVMRETFAFGVAIQVIRLFYMTPVIRVFTVCSQTSAFIHIGTSKLRHLEMRGPLLRLQISSFATSVIPFHIKPAHFLTMDILPSWREDTPCEEHL